MKKPEKIPTALEYDQQIKEAERVEAEAAAAAQEATARRANVPRPVLNCMGAQVWVDKGGGLTALATPHTGARVTFDYAEALALRDFLNEVYPKEPQP